MNNETELNLDPEAPEAEAAPADHAGLLEDAPARARHLHEPDRAARRAVQHAGVRRDGARQHEAPDVLRPGARDGEPKPAAGDSFARDPHVAGTRCSRRKRDESQT